MEVGDNAMGCHPASLAARRFRRFAPFVERPQQMQAEQHARPGESERSHCDLRSVYLRERSDQQATHRLHSDHEKISG